MFESINYIGSIYSDCFKVITDIYNFIFFHKKNLHKFNFDSFDDIYINKKLTKKVFSKCNYDNIYYDWIILDFDNIKNIILHMHNECCYNKYSIKLKEQGNYNRVLNKKENYINFYNIFQYKETDYEDNCNIFYNCIYDGQVYNKVIINNLDIDLSDVKITLSNYNYNKSFYLDLLVSN